MGVGQLGSQAVLRTKAAAVEAARLVWMAILYGL